MWAEFTAEGAEQAELPTRPKTSALDGVRMNVGYSLDLLVDDLVLVELKAVERPAPIHEAQLLSRISS